MNFLGFWCDWKEVEFSEQSCRPRCLNVEFEMKWSETFLDFEEVELSRSFP